MYIQQPRSRKTNLLTSAPFFLKLPQPHPVPEGAIEEDIYKPHELESSGLDQNTRFELIFKEHSGIFFLLLLKKILRHQEGERHIPATQLRRENKGENMSHIKQRRHLHRRRTVTGIARGDHDMSVARRGIEVAG